MSELGNFLANQIDQQKTTAMEMSSRLGVGSSHLSMLIKGKRRSVNTETLSRMVVGISDDDSIRAKFLQAYFRDQVNPSIKDWIYVGKTVAREDAPVYDKNGDAISRLEKLLRQEAVPTAVVRAFHKIVTAMPGQHALQELIKELGNFTEDALHPATRVFENELQIRTRTKGKSGKLL